jgi:hypothetical protein
VVEDGAFYVPLKKISLKNIFFSESTIFIFVKGKNSSWQGVWRIKQDPHIGVFMKFSKILGSMVLAVAAVGVGSQAFADAADTDLKTGEQITDTIGLQLDVACAASITAENGILAGGPGPRYALSGSRSSTTAGKISFSGKPIFTVASQCPYKMLLATPKHLEEPSGDQLQFIVSLHKNDVRMDTDYHVSGAAAGVVAVSGPRQEATASQQYGVNIVSGDQVDVAQEINNVAGTAPRSGTYTSSVVIGIEAL